MIGLMIGGFDLAGGLEGFVGRVIEQRVGQWSADALVEQDEHERRFDALVSETVAVGPSDAFEQAVGFHLAKVLAELGEGVTAGGEAEGGEDGLMNAGAAPSVELGTAVEEHLHQPQHPRVMDLDAGDFWFCRP